MTLIDSYNKRRTVYKTSRSDQAIACLPGWLAVPWRKLAKSLDVDQCHGQKR